MRIPLISPISFVAHMAKSSSQRSAKPLYPVRVRGAPPSGQRKKAIRQSGGLEIAGALPAGPTIFDSAKAQRAAHVIGNDAGPVRLRLADRFPYGPVAQHVEHPALNRKVGGANPPGAAI